MIAELDVVLLPQLVVPGEIRRQTVVMVDVLRASTTMVAALSQGADAIYPCAEISVARQLKMQIAGTVILGGERNGKMIDGFDAGNSPLEYGHSRVNGHAIVLCTTNGTYTLEACRNARKILVGSFVNLSAICHRIERQPHVAIVCAGTDRCISDEDVLFAGAVVLQIRNRNPGVLLGDAAQIAASRWQDVASRVESGQVELWEVLAASRGGRNLMKLDYRQDIRFCSRIDLFDTVPELDMVDWVLR